MDSQMQPHNAPLHAGEGEDETHHEKKSVMKKVKAKAKKIKDTLKLYGHAQHDDHDHGPVPDDHDLDEEDEEDEEMVDDPEVHGSAGSSSAAIRGSVPEKVEKLGDAGTCYGSSGAMKDRDDSSEYSEAKVTDPLKGFAPGQEVAVDMIRDIKEVPQAPQNTPASINPGIVNQPKANDPNPQSFVQEKEAIRGQPEINMEQSPRFEEDPAAPKNRPHNYKPSNYEAKVTDPTGEGPREVEVSSIAHSLDKINLSDESKHEREGNIHTRQPDQSMFPTRSHAQFSPEQSPQIPISAQENPESVSNISNASKSEDHPHDETATEAPKQSSYTEKISAATSVMADKAISAKNVVVSKLGYGQKDDIKEREFHGQEDKASASSPVTEKLTPVYEKVTEGGSNLMAKAPGAGPHSEGRDKGVSVKNYLAEKLKPGEEHKALSEVIAERLHKQDNGTEKKTGEVKESEEVKRQLGTAEEKSEESVEQSSVSVPQIGVVERIKGMVGSYLGKGKESHSEQSLGSSTGTEGFPASKSEEETGERRIE